MANLTKKKEHGAPANLFFRELPDSMETFLHVVDSVYSIPDNKYFREFLASLAKSWNYSDSYFKKYWATSLVREVSNNLWVETFELERKQIGDHKAFTVADATRSNFLETVFSRVRENCPVST